ncbi:hypothetical protein TorRG33x02_348610 [Trema orientale]|uniref:Uncharacterized protein n=1 Tax=Trema orientale TaxID=63057 RepID=A0A2P5AJZ4_TREOI|nr:hypothetical protein TorRG33x02_348610 [Trema orientale]
MFSPWSCQTKLFSHVQLTRQHTIREFPIKAVNKLSHHQPDHSQTKLQSGAASSARAKGKKLKVSSPDIYATPHKPLWEKLLWFSPNIGVSSNCPNVYHNARVFGYVEAIDYAIFHGCMRKQQWSHWMKPQALFYNHV